MNTKITSKLGGAMNYIAQEIKGVSMIKLGDTPNDGEIITIEFKDGTKKHINTATSNVSSSLNTVMRKKETVLKLQNTGRLTYTLKLGKYKNGTRLQVCNLVMLANDFLNDEVPNSYIGLDVNHLDRTGNKFIYGYINNKLYNLEKTSSQNDKRHWRCVDRVQQLTGVHIGFSANDTKLLDLFEYGKDEEIIEAINKYYSFEDKHGTKYLSAK